ncbi:MAG: VanZ family protein [Bacteroidales bacterium]
MKIRGSLQVKILFVFYILFLFFLCFTNFGSLDIDLPTNILGIGIDKYIHSLMFFPYPILAWLVFQYSRHLKKYSKYALSLSAISGMVIAIFTESVQFYFLPNREGDPLDFFADTIGLVLSFILLYFIMGALKKKVEKSTEIK